MKRHNGVESYVPVAAFYEGKREAAGRLFRDRFAVVDIKNRFEILASRGEQLPVGKPLTLTQEWDAFLRQKLVENNRVLVPAEGETALFFGDWKWGGLVPVLLLDAPFTELFAAAKYLLRREIILPDFLPEPELKTRKLSHLCHDFSESLAACDRVFSRREIENFRHHVALISEFSGCRGNFDALPLELFPLAAQDQRKWTIFLLCLFLSLRGVSEKEPAFSMRQVGSKTIFGETELYRSQTGKGSSNERLFFLRHPAFADIEVEATKESLRISVALAKRQKPGEIRAVVSQTRLCFILEAA